MSFLTLFLIDSAVSKPAPRVGSWFILLGFPPRRRFTSRRVDGSAGRIEGVDQKIHEKGALGLFFGESCGYRLLSLSDYGSRVPALLMWYMWWWYAPVPGYFHFLSFCVLWFHMKDMVSYCINLGVFRALLASHIDGVVLFSLLQHPETKNWIKLFFFQTGNQAKWWRQSESVWIQFDFLLSPKIRSNILLLER